MKSKIPLLLFFLIQIFYLVTYAQEEKQFFIHNYSPKTYKASPQNWSVVQDQRGLMFFGNTDGVLEYDGKNWKRIPIENGVRALALDFQGVVYVGATMDLGYLAPDSLGELQFTSLLDKVPDAYKNFGEVWQIVSVDKEVFFRTNKNLFAWNGEKMKVFNPKQPLRSIAQVDGKFYAAQADFGLVTKVKDSLELIQGGEFFSDKRVRVILQYPDNQLLIQARYGKKSDKAGQYALFIFDIKTGTSTAFHTEAQDFIQKRIYDAITLANNQYAFASLADGIMIIDKFGNIVEHISKQNGLTNETVICLQSDKEGALWAGLNNGINRIEYASPWRFWKDELDGIITAKRHLDRLYVGTYSGVYYLENDVLTLMEGSPEEIHDFMEFQNPISGDIHSLLVASYSGVWEVKNKELTQLPPQDDSYVFKLYQSKKHLSCVFKGHSKGLEVIYFKNNSWQKKHQVLSKKITEIIDIIEDREGKLWVSTAYEGLYVLELAYSQDSIHIINTEHYDTAKGLPSNNNIGMQMLHKELLFHTEGGFYRFDKQKKLFFPETSLNQHLDSPTKPIYASAINHTQDIWLSEINTAHGDLGILKMQEEGGYKWNAQPFSRLPKFEMNQIYLDGDSLAWICSSENLFCYDQKNNAKDYKQGFNTLLRYIKIGEDSSIFKGVFDLKYTSKQHQKQIPTLNYQDNSLTFYYSATSFDKAEATLFSYYLEGFDKKGTWSAWHLKTEKEYTRLWEGDYTFYVKSKNIYGTEGSTTQYSFTILPPFYRSKLAILLYFIAFILMIWGFVQLNTRRLKAKKKELEQMVTQRTQELQLKNTELKLQKEEILAQGEQILETNEELVLQTKILAKRNKNIHKSMNYAQRIQEAVFPKVSKIEAILPQSFVFFKSLEAVSGDFYYFTQQNDKIILAAVDCTGHGIPGGFMSMIGYKILNELIQVKNITQPAEILNNLHQSIVNDLHQDTSNSRDGMDICLVSLDLENKKLEVAAARNPLYLFNRRREEYFQIIPADRVSIGGVGGQERVFTNHEIDLIEGDTFYLFSDGFQDQFGGKNARKYLRKNFQNFLASIQKYPMQKQGENIAKEFDDWKGTGRQIDDILVMGFRITF